MAMPGRTYNSSEYRYSHNGQEKDDEIFQGALSAEYWEVDARIGRRWNTDPLAYAWETPYNDCDNNPIALCDLAGLYGDDPATLTKVKPKPKLNVKTFGDLITEGIEAELNSVEASIGFKAVGWIVTFVFSPLECGGPGMPQPIIYIGKKATELPSIELERVRRNVESGRGTPNDHKIYNEVFAPKAQAPFKTQSHHVIPVSAFSDISNPLFALASKDPNFANWMDDEDGINRMPLGADVHGNHPAYTDRIMKEAEQIFRDNRPVTAEDAAKLIRSYIGKMKGEIRTEINKNPGVRLNQVYKNKGYGAPKPKIGVAKKGGTKGGATGGGTKKKKPGGGVGKGRYDLKKPKKKK